MNCRSFDELTALAVGDDVPKTAAGRRDHERLESHLLTCASCQRFATEMELSHRALRSLADAPIDEEALAAVRAGTRRQLEQPRRFWGPPNSHRALAAAAGLVVVLGAVAMLRWLPNTSHEPPKHDPPNAAPTVALPVAINETATLSLPTSPQGPVEPAEPQPSTSRVIEPAAATGQPSGPLAVSSVSIQPPRSESADLLPTPPATDSALRTPSQAAAAPNRTDSAVETPAPPIQVTHAPSEPMVIKLISEDADLVIYWLVNPPPEATEENTDELSAV